MSISTAILPLAPLSPKTTTSIGISRCQLNDETPKSRLEEAISMPSKDDDLPYHMCPHC
ncbi:unnamed protein product, partial [Anisakis simplex]|uniref:LITAF domain-containing protein n=1 Tax=Anisakis simplex TaxID=6269 RepID=A0A0M3JJA5_ANISI